jgi:hypothetical protein
MSDIGPMLPGRWQTSHFSWKIGATSFVNVSGRFPVAGVWPAASDGAPAAPMTRTAAGTKRARRPRLIFFPFSLFFSPGLLLSTVRGGEPGEVSHDYTDESPGIATPIQIIYRSLEAPATVTFT